MKAGDMTLSDNPLDQQVRPTDARSLLSLVLPLALLSRGSFRNLRGTKWAYQGHGPVGVSLKYE
jgi:hypothetical protein